MEPRITRELVGEAKTTEISQSKFEKGMKKYGSKLGHLTLATGISCTIGPILGSTRALSGMASKVWNMTKHDFTEHKLEKLKGQNLSEGDRTKALEKLEKELAESKGKIQKDQKVIISGFLAMLPGVGVIAANSYLKSKDPNIQEKGLEGLVLTNYKNLTKGILGINKKINQVATNFIESKLYPVSGQSIKEHLENPNITEEEGLKQLEKKFDDSFDKTLQPPEMKTKIDLTVDRGDGKEHTLNALFIGNIEEISTRPTMVLFHGNGQTHHDNGEIARYYHDRGFNVFTLTMGGYPGSDPGVKTSEVSTCQDVNAVIQALKNKGAKEIGVHGTSIGGTLAFTAADQHPDVVKFVVADQTLNKGNDVAINFVKNMIIPNDTAKNFYQVLFYVEQQQDLSLKEGKFQELL